MPVSPQTFFQISAFMALCACTIPDSRSGNVGKQDFVRFCSSCHGVDGTGNGPAASRLAAAPADLTTLRMRSGGEFPFTAVMSKIWGNAKNSHRATMPGFAELFEGEEMVPFDGGDGIYSPTPTGLVQLAQYLETLQK